MARKPVSRKSTRSARGTRRTSAKRSTRRTTAAAAPTLNGNQLRSLKGNVTRAYTMLEKAWAILNTMEAPARSTRKATTKTRRTTAKRGRRRTTATTVSRPQEQQPAAINS